MEFSNSENFSKVINHTVIKSPKDKNEYYYDILPNGLKYIIVSNKDIDKSAVGLDVYIGAADDPKEYQGLAHCLEHVIFLGTKKYPNASEFDDFLNLNSGYSNANTSLDHTNFHFEICNEQLEKGIDMFSEFFIEPLFTEEFIKKELNAIDSEFKLDYRDDLTRIFFLFLIEGYKDSSFNTFINGNLETLQKIEIRNKVIEFYNSKYDPKIMSLCVISNKSIDEIKNMVVKYFSRLQKNKNFYKSPKTILYDNNNMGYIYKIIPIKDISDIRFFWIINKNYTSYYKSQPCNYVISVLGHESRHSLTSYLKKKQYIYGLDSSYDDTYKSYLTIQIKINLTDEGFKNINEVIKIVLSYINYLQKEEIHKDYFEEIKKCSEIDFYLDVQYDPIELCEDISSSLYILKTDDEIFVKNKIEEYRPDLIKELLDSLTLKNLNIYIVSSKLKEINNNKNDGEKIIFNVEKIYGIEYIKEKMDFSSFIIDIKSNNLDLSYPELNPFLPNNLNMIDLKLGNIDINDYSTPKKVVSDNERTIWYKPNIKYNMPKVLICCEAYISNLNIDFTSYNLYSDIFLKLINKEMSEFLYLGETSDNSFSLTFSFSSILINIDGYSDSIEKYIVEYLNKLNKFIEIPKIEDIYNKLIIICDNIIKNTNNFYMGNVQEQTIFQLKRILRKIISKNKLEFCRKFKSEVENNIIPEEFLTFIKNLFKKVKYECLVEGNFFFRDAENIITKIESGIKKAFCLENKNRELLSINEIRKQQIIELPQDKIYRYNFYSKDKENESSTILIYFQIGNYYYNNSDIINKEMYKENIRVKSLIFFMRSIFYESFYDELRTQQQVGYDVNIQISNMHSIFGIYFYISSTKYNPDEINEKINNFIVDKNLNEEKNFSDEDFESFRKSVINELIQKPLTLDEEFNRDFSFISNRTYNFSLRKDLISYINDKVTKQDVIDFFNEYIFGQAKRLEIALYRPKINNKEEEKEMDIEEREEKTNDNKKNNEKKILPSYENKKIEIINDINDFHRQIKYYENEFY